MRRCVIVGGADIGNYERVSAYVGEDDYSEMEYVTSASALVEDSFSYFSTINISGVTRNICIENAKYPLHNAEIQSGYRYGISNEVLPGKTAKITVGEGSALLIKVFK